VQNCRNLTTEWQFYVIKAHALRKVFISIKGIYYQADIRGQIITWVVPFKFTQKIGTDVDYKVMLSFLEFHEILLGFVNFKLFHELSLNYPPKFSEELSARGEDLEAIQQEVPKILDKTVDNGENLGKKKEEDKQKEKLIAESKNRLSTLTETLKKLKNPMRVPAMRVMSLKIILKMNPEIQKISHVTRKIMRKRLFLKETKLQNLEKSSLFLRIYLKNAIFGCHVRSLASL